MRLRGVHHVEVAVLDYERSIAFYDRMFGWLGYQSFSTLGIGYVSTYYVAYPHSYIGIQPAEAGARLDHEAQATGIHHIALHARSRREVDRFHREFLVPGGVEVTDPPAAYPIYFPDYYAVFFLDPTGIRWELAYTPRVPWPWALWRWVRLLGALRGEHPEWKRHPVREAVRRLPRG